MDEGPTNQSGLSARVTHLLGVARAAFVADGFDRVSIDAVARQAGVSKETIYRHFPDKQALFRAAMEETAGQFSMRAQALHRSGLGALEEPRAMARAILEAAIDGGLLVPFWLGAGLGGRMPDFAAELQRTQTERLEPVREALAAATARAVSSEDALDFGSLAVEGSKLLMGFDPPAPATRGALAARVAALFGQGVLGMQREPSLATRDDGVADVWSAAPWPPHLRRLLDVAAVHFLRDGYEAASLSGIGAEARVGRGTLYRHFAHKAGLFNAVLRDLARAVAAGAAPPLLENERGLEAYFVAATANLTGPVSVALHRAAISTSRRDPALARAVHDTVRAPWIEPLATWIATVAGHPDARWLALQGIVLAMQGNRAIAAGHGPAPDALEAHGKRTAAIFLHGLGC